MSLFNRFFMDSIKYLHFEISTSKEGDYKVPFFQLISAMNLSQESEIESLKLAVLPTIMCTAAGLGKLAKLKEAIALVSLFSIFVALLALLEYMP